VGSNEVAISAGDDAGQMGGDRDEAPYLSDAGPLCFFPAGIGYLTSGWGSQTASYKITANRVIV
jgi:hypothetical protein